MDVSPAAESPGTVSPAAVDDAVRAVDQAVAAGLLSAGGAKNLKRWLTEPYYAAYRERLLQRIADREFATLDAMFWEVIPFGTGGRRGQMGEYGSATINDRTIAESAYGLATYLHQATGRSGGKAAIACDTRRRSDHFARLTATTLAAAGLEVYCFEGHRSTPELSFAVRHLGCDVGVVISASHNPPADNGFKAYWSDGAQVLPPHDKGIIEAVYKAGEIPTLDFDEAVAAGQIKLIGAEIDAAYVKAVTSLSLSRQRNIPALYSPLHGVGETSVYAVIQAAGFPSVEIFEFQRAADGSFPNVADCFPNPERPVVFAPAIAHAQKTGAEVVLASDPDADRLGVAVRGSGGEFVHLTGNRIGALLTDYVLRKRAAAGTLTPQHYVVETLVTTPLVAALARAHQVRAIDDLLVGFKYIAQVMEREGPAEFVFGAEESLGYLSGSYARDKDAAIAALYLLENAAELRNAGKTLLDRLHELYTEHGYFLEDQSSEVRTGPQGKQQIDDLMRAFRAQPPAELAGVKLARVRDYGKHEVRELPANTKSADLPAPSGDLVFFESAPSDACEIKLAVRPSGTEPKIKYYFFATGKCPSEAELGATKSRVDGTLKAFMQALSAWAAEVK